MIEPNARSSRVVRALLWAGPLLAAPSTAWAVDTSSTATVAAPSADVSDEELRLLGAALGEDEALASETPPPKSTAGQIGEALASGLQSLNPDMAFILDVALGYFSDEPRSVGAHDPQRTGFTFQQLELSVSAAVDPFLRFDANIVLAQFGVEVEEAYATSLGLPYRLQLRAGQFLTPFGRQNATHPHTWSFMDQPLVLGKFFGGEGSRGLGAEVSWLVPVPWFAAATLAVNDAAGACCARSFFGARDLGVKSPADLLYTLRLHQFIPFDEDWSVMIGLSSQLGPNPTGNGNRTEIYGTDLYLRYRPVASTTRSSLSLQAEAILRARQVPGDALVDFGAFAQLVWTITFQWELGLRFEYVTGVADDPLDLDWDQDRRRFSAQATFYPSHFSRVRVQANYDDPKYAERPTWAALLNFEVVVGAHGSHDY